MRLKPGLPKKPFPHWGGGDWWREKWVRPFKAALRRRWRRGLRQALHWWDAQ